MLKINQKTKAIGPLEIVRFATEFAQIDDIILLTLGEPDFPAPDHVKKATIEAIEQNKTGYGPGHGLIELRQEICHFLERKYGLHYEADNIIVTSGLSEATGTLMLATLNPGDKVLIPTPHYAPYELDTILANGEAIFLDTSVDHFKMTPDHLDKAMAAHPDAKFLVMVYPSNPTGVSYSKEEIEALAACIKKYDLLVFADEIYSELTYVGPHTSLAAYIPDQVVLMNGVSKVYSMTGWRIGFIASPPAYTEAIKKAHDFTNYITNVFNQIGAIQAYRHGDDDIIRMRDQYVLRREYIVAALRDLGFEVHAPEGAFYVFPRIPDAWGMDDQTFALNLARQAKVATIPGSCFGEAGKHHLRISFAASIPTLEEAVARMRKYIATIK